MITIKSMFDNKILASGSTVKEVVEHNKHNLQGAYLYEVNLQSVDLQNASLQDANLRETNLQGANLQGANLQRALLRKTNLQGVNLKHADLRDSYPQNADLRGADLQGADLRGANLRDADLRGANLQGANLERANLEDANLQDAICPLFWHCPKTGSFLAFKKLCGNRIALLEIPAHAKRTSSLIGTKCRAELAKVLKIESVDGTEQFTSGVSYFDAAYVYTVGEIHRPTKPFDDDIRVECASGIHFFMTREEAVSF